MNELEFKAFDSIPRLFRECVVTEKIDGTNAVVYVSDDAQVVRAGSRSRWIQAEPTTADNYGFARWVADHEDELRGLGPGYHYGEWWGAGIQRRYGLAEKRWSLFNAGRWGEGGTDADKKPACCHVVPVLYRGKFETGDLLAVASALKEHGSKAAPGFSDPEGIVVWHESGRCLFKYTLDGDGHKGARGKR